MTGHFTSYETRTDHELATGAKKSLPRSAAFSKFRSTGLTPWKKTSDVNGPKWSACISPSFQDYSVVVPFG
jgi:hypothetical protein